MKKLFLVLGIVCLLITCKNDSMEKKGINPLIGTWDNVNPPPESDLHLEDITDAQLATFTRRLLITKSEITYYADKHKEPNWTNNYTYDEFEIKVYNPKYPDYSVTIKIDGEYLYLEPFISDHCFKKVK